ELGYFDGPNSLFANQVRVEYNRVVNGTRAPQQSAGTTAIGVFAGTDITIAHNEITEGWAGIEIRPGCPSCVAALLIEGNRIQDIGSGSYIIVGETTKDIAIHRNRFRGDDTAVGLTVTNAHQVQITYNLVEAAKTGAAVAVDTASTEVEVIANRYCT